MKKFILSITLLVSLVLSMANPANATKVAVVDIQAVVAKSAQVQNLKKENDAKVTDLQKWLKTAQADVQKQKTAEAKEKLTKKYDDELKKKQEANKKIYADKIQAIDKSITDTIINEAKIKGYDFVVTKQGVILYGGFDITDDIIKVVK